MKAVFLYNFTRYFEWPENKKLNNFVIYVVGKNESLMSELKNLAAKKKVGNQEIEIKTLLNSIQKSFQILYIFRQTLLIQLAMRLQKQKTRSSYRWRNS